MGKKQRKKRNVRNAQRTAGSKQGTMTPVPISGDEVGAKAVCVHVERGVKLEKLRSRLQSKPSHCQTCKRSRRAKPGAVNDLWICLACGNIGCGWHTPDAKDSFPRFLHAAQHLIQFDHPVVMRWGDSLDCWCLECDKQLKYAGVFTTDDDETSRPRLLQKAAALVQEGQSSHTVVNVASGQDEASSTPTKTVAKPIASRRVIKGLMNLGNTCFFNSVMQNLVGVSMLREHFSQEPSMPEGVLKGALRKFFQEMDPPADSGTAAPDGALTRTLHSLSFGGSVGNAVSPRGLFSAICTKAPRFKGFQQQDSHELLRCLLDGLHVEEENIRKAAEPESNGSAQKKVPETFVEHMFGGQLSSTVSCCECGHSSVVYEPYLDLSLPIPSKQERSRVEPIRELPKLIAQRSQKGIVSGNGVLSVKTEPETKSTPVEEAPVLGCSLGPLSMLDGGTTLDYLEEKLQSSSIDDKELPAALPFPCEPISEGVACSSGGDKGGEWLEFLCEPAHEKQAAMSFLDERNDFDTPATVSGEAERGEEIVNPFSMQGGGIEPPLEDGNQIEEEQDKVEYGPQLPGADYKQQECLDLVLYLPAGPLKDQTIPSSLEEETKAGVKPSASVEDGDFDGVAGLFGDEDAFSRNDTVSSATQTNSFSPFDTISGDLQMSGGRAVSARSVREVETYPIMSLEGCLQAFTKTEVLSGENAWGCENCTRIAHGLREEPAQDKAEDASSSEVANNGSDATEGDGMQGEWESLGLMEELSTSTSIVVVPEPTAEPSNSGNNESEMMDNEEPSSSANSDESKAAGSQPSTSGIEDPYVMVEASEDTATSRNGTRRRNNVTKEKTGKKRLPAKKEAPKMTTVLRDATKRLLISKAPLVLTVHLKRFAQDMHGRLSKLSGHITFHEQLDLSPFIDQRDGSKQDGVYQLIGTVEHSGTMRGGHYVAYVKGSENDEEASSEGGSSTWYYISDSHVRKTSLESVLRSEAYLLFYERQRA